MSLKKTISPPIIPGPIDWIFEADFFVKKVERLILVFVCSHKGSTPRETGAWLIVAKSKVFGTIGGGEVENSVIKMANELLEGRQLFQRRCQNFNLGPDLGQCCGGFMKILFEPIENTGAQWLLDAQSIASRGGSGHIEFSTLNLAKPPIVHNGRVPDGNFSNRDVHIQPMKDQRPKVIVYGAGHVGRAIAGFAQQLPINLLVVDERKSELDQVSVCRNVKVEFVKSPVSHAIKVSGQKAVIIMTHNHGLDYRLCQVFAEKADLVYLGLIGSKVKLARFRRALKLEGMTSDQISNIICPIGAGGPIGKEPGIIALSTLSELIKSLDLKV